MNFERALALQPNELPLHYKVWRLLLATNRRTEAMESYRTTCEKLSCQPHVQTYHGCVATSASLQPRG